MIATIIILFLSVLKLGMDISNHGKEKTKKENAYISFVATGIVMVLYYYAGLFDKFN